MINKINFAKKLVDLRSKCGLSQSKLADMLYISGQAISKWETANSLPDIELLYPLSQILGVSADYLLGNEQNNFNNDSEAFKKAATAYDISDESINILTAVSDSLSKEYLYKTAKYIEKDMFAYKISLELTSNIDNIKNYYKRDVDLLACEKDALTPFSKELSNLTLQALNNEYNPVQEILGFMKCPNCGKDFEYIKTAESEYISCGEHKFDINEGVVDFKTLEIPGFTWSSWIRRYDDYKKQIIENTPKNNNISNDIEALSKLDKNIVIELQKQKPPIILDIGSGSAYGARKFMKFIDWECVIILTDLSHRILKYDKRYVDEISENPKIKFVYIACDVRNLPFKDNALPCILSYGGYCSVLYGLEKSFLESYRVLKNGGQTITDVEALSDKKDENVQKWLKLIQKEIGHYGDMMSEYYENIHDVKEWHELIKEFGFKDFMFVKCSEEITAPETDVFPYDCEISRWSGTAFIAAVK